MKLLIIIGSILFLVACQANNPSKENTTDATVSATPEIDTAALYAEGKRIYLENQCDACHAMDQHLTGPALRGVVDKRPKEWLYAFTRNSLELVSTGDSVAVQLYQEWKGTMMPPYTNLTDEELYKMYFYIENKKK